MTVLLECCLDGISGGTTPSIGTIKVAGSILRGSSTKLHVLIRPRVGDFVYSSAEKQVILEDAKAAIAAGAQGIVIGALTPEGRIDEEVTAAVVEEASNADKTSVTFHRAFDCCKHDPLQALETLIRLGIDRVLTSGRAATAWEGRALLAQLVRAADERIVIMPGAGISLNNVADVVRCTGALEVHIGSGCHELTQLSPTDDGIMADGVIAEFADQVRIVSAKRVSEIVGDLSKWKAHPSRS